MAHKSERAKIMSFGLRRLLLRKRVLKELNERLQESEKLGEVVKRRGNQYIKEDWNGFIIQGLVEEL